MSEPKPFASLGPTLLARKGGARPAMRPQIGPMGGAMTALSVPAVPAEPDLEDLGWNDMGDHDDTNYHEDYREDEEAREETREETREASLLSLVPEDTRPATAVPEPEVHRQQRAIAGTVSAMPSRAVERAQAKDGRRAAFTLRLDADRHLRLRLASTVKNCSAQALVTEALDRFLADIPQLDALTAQLKRD